MKMSKLYIIFIIVYSMIVVSSSYDYKNENFKLSKNWDIIKTISPLIGFPRLWPIEGDPLLSESDIQNTLKSWNLNSSLTTKYYQEDNCVRDLIRVGSNIQEKWAISMLDADGKIPPGILYGNTAWTGAYRECLAIRAPSNPAYNYLAFDGKYCTVVWNTEGSITGSIGVCVPDTCDESDFTNINKTIHVLMGRNLLPQLNKAVKPPISIQGMTCQPKTTKYDAGAISVLTIIYVFVFLVVIGTSLTIIDKIFSSRSSQDQEISENQDNTAENDYPKKKKSIERENSEISINSSPYESLIQTSNSPGLLEMIEKFLKCFCLITNGQKLLDITVKGESDLSCFHGIRFLSMVWVLLGHTYFFCVMSSLVGNVYDVLNLTSTVGFQLLLQGPYSVDSFFVMSGFLLTYLFLREITKTEGKISWISFYFHRYWRLTPVYMIIMAFDTTISKYLISGPLQPVTYEEGCKQTWWWNLLYINNFAKKPMCMGWSWYLANDMQFYVISPIFLYALWKKPKIGLGIIITLLCASLISNFYIGYHYLTSGIYSIIPAEIEFKDWLQQLAIYFDKIYIKPYTRIGPYLIGVLVAYLVFRLNGRRNFLSMRTQVLGWTISTAMALFVMLGLYNAQLTHIGTVFYLTFHRTIYSISFAWIIFACLTGHGGIINKMLSFRIYVPLGRLTYCAYLVHPIIITLYYLNMPSKIILTHLEMVLLFLGFLVFSFGIAMATTLLFESPAMAIERLLRTKKRQ